jgi:hypothetical protein
LKCKISIFNKQKAIFLIENRFFYLKIYNAN